MEQFWERGYIKGPVIFNEEQVAFLRKEMERLFDGEGMMSGELVSCFIILFMCT